MMEGICEDCEKGELQKHDTWWRYKTPFDRRLTSEQPVEGTIYKCSNEDCLSFFYDDDENDELKEGYPC